MCYAINPGDLSIANLAFFTTVSKELRIAFHSVQISLKFSVKLDDKNHFLSVAY